MEFEEPYEMNIGVFAYNGKTVATLTNENETRPPYSIKLLDNSLYVFVSDYGSGKLYMDYQNFSDGISYYQDSKLAVAQFALPDGTFHRAKRFQNRPGNRQDFIVASLARRGKQSL